MIQVNIGGSERALNEASETWIAEQIARRRATGASLCVQVVIRSAGLNLRLSTPGCGGGGGSRPPNPEENQILEAWRRHHLQDDSFLDRDLVAFLHEVERLR